MILYHTDRLFFLCEAKHQLDEVAPWSEHPCWAKDPGCSNDKRLSKVRLGIQLSGELRNGIGAQWVRGISFHVWTTLGPIENVISRVVNQLHIGLTARHCNIADRQSVCLIGC